ncbi:MAG TPA: DUF2191 domain-containing protein [Actinomycetota bacterium]
MKTTIELPSDLVTAAKRVAAAERTTLRAIIEAALRAALEARQTPRPFTLRDAGVGGTGLTDAFASAGWEQIRDAAYSGRGG